MTKREVQEIIDNFNKWIREHITDRVRKSVKVKSIEDLKIVTSLARPHLKKEGK